MAERAVGKVVVEMRARLGEQLTVDDMARTARFSRYHFTRLFQRVTGVSPMRFLSAVRIQHAKELLVSTDWNVADIGNCVGYRSASTFSSRFTTSVGLSPIAYRRGGGLAPVKEPPGAGRPGATVLGTVEGPAAPGGVVHVGVFPKRLPEGFPVACVVLPRPGSFVLSGVPEGEWYVLACASGSGRRQDGARAGCRGRSVGSVGPVTVRRDTARILADVRLRPMGPLDPPVLSAVLDARPVFTTGRDCQS